MIASDPKIIVPNLMQISLPTPYKVWMLVLVPLLLQLGFVAVLVSLLHQIEIERKQERYGREVEAHLTALLRILVTAGSASMQSQLSSGTTALRSIKSDAQRVDNETDALKELTKDDSRRRATVYELTVQLGHVRESLTRINADLKADNTVNVILEGRSLKRQIDRTFVFIDQVLAVQQSNREAATRAQDAYRQRIKVLLIVGVTLNILIALLFSAYFHKGIVRRLRALMDNTVRLSRGQELSPMIAGDDEIALLDSVFRAMANSVNEMTRRERAVLEHSADVICSLDRKGNFTAINPAMERICGYAPADLLGHPLIEIVVVDHQPTATALQQIVKEKSEASFENQIRHKKGPFVDMLWSAKWSQDEESLFCVARDTSRGKELERLKRDFVAMVSHDLRTPLTTIQMFLDVASVGAYGELAEADRKDISAAEASVERLSALVNNVLDMEKIESGQLSICCENTSLNSLFQRALRMVSPSANERSIEIAVVAPAEANVRLDGDRISWVITTFLANAIKFSSPASIVTLSASVNIGWIKIEVTDQAIELPENLRESIFDRFVRLEASKQWQEPTLRIGLAICKAVVEKHGGKIGVESHDGCGNRFWFLLPVNPD
ncbi:hypothetical protein BH10CYA1_BH10CYA1_58340 [soil metagenome]